MSPSHSLYHLYCGHFPSILPNVVVLNKRLSLIPQICLNGFGFLSVTKCTSFCRHSDSYHQYLYRRVSPSCDVVTLARPPYSSLKVNNRSFRHASPHVWNELPKELRQPVDNESMSLSSHLSLTSSSEPSSSLPLCITPSLFHFRLKTYFFHKSFQP